MAISYVGASTTWSPANGVSGTTNTASTVAITPGLPAGTAAGDRVFVMQVSTIATGATPADWTELVKGASVGQGLTAAGAGRRWLSIYYRDYDGSWTMPAFTLTSAANNSHAASAIALRKASNEVWDTPTIPAFAATYFPATPGTAYSATSPSWTLVTGGYTFAATVLNDNVSSSAPGGTTTGGIVLGTRDERYDNGTATGFDVRLVIGTAPVVTGGTGTITRTATLSGASQGGTLWGQQTVTTYAPTVSDSFNRADSSASMGIANTGQAWIADGGTWGISNNQAYPVSGGGMARITPGPVPRQVSVTIAGTMPTPGQAAGLVFRHQSKSTYYDLDIQGNGGIELVQHNFGATAVLNNPNAGFVSGDRLTILDDGSTIKILRNGIEVGSHASTLAATASTVGIKVYDTSEPRFEDFYAGTIVTASGRVRDVWNGSALIRQKAERWSGSALVAQKYDV